jgi:hypothetical protein
MSGAAALIAIAHPILNPSASLKTASTLSGAWFAILKDYELLWSQLPSISEAAAQELYTRIVSEEKKLAELESTLHVRRNIVLDCQDEVCASRGLPMSKKRK